MEMAFDDVVTFCQTDLKSNSFAAFEDMRKKEELCDFRIMAQDKEIIAHRVVVAAGIPYFRSTFVGAEDQGIILGDIDSSVLESLIDFAYTSRVNISKENVHRILYASSVLQLDKVHEACVEFLSKRLDVSNTWQVRSLAISLDITHLIQISNRYILENIEEFAKSVEFSNLQESHLTQILSQENVNVSDEKAVFDAVIDWVKVSPFERQAALPELMNQIRMVYLPIQYLSERVASEEVIRTSSICRVMINEVQNYHLFPKKKSMFPSVKTNPRHFKGLYAICKDGGDASISYCDFVNQMWHSVSSSGECAGIIFLAVAVNEKLYMFCEEQINIFNTKTLEWHVVLLQEYEIRYGTTAGTIENVIYFFGSDNPDLRHRILCFDTEENMWHEKGIMKKQRCKAAATELIDTSCIYVMGGLFNLNDVEKYCPLTNQCTPVAPMLESRYSHSAVTMNGKIYVCGGTSVRGSSEMYDPVVDRWTLISAVNTNQLFFPLVAHNSELHAVVNSDTNTSKICESYSPEINKWESNFAMPEGFIKVVAVK